MANHLGIYMSIWMMLRQLGKHLATGVIGGVMLMLGACVLPVQAAPSQTVLVMGDSISAEYGLARGTGWVALLQKRLDVQQPGWKVVNASISGDTTAGGRARLVAALRAHQPRVVVIELGANDALRGLPLAQTRANLAEMVRQSHQTGARVLLLGMQVPPNYGASYTKEFAAVFAHVARDAKVQLVPFLLAGIADVPDAQRLWFQTDRIHPNQQAQAKLLDNVWPALAPMLLPRK